MVAAVLVSVEGVRATRFDLLAIAAALVSFLAVAWASTRKHAGRQAS